MSVPTKKFFKIVDLNPGNDFVIKDGLVDAKEPMNDWWTDSGIWFAKSTDILRFLNKGDYVYEVMPVGQLITHPMLSNAYRADRANIKYIGKWSDFDVFKQIISNGADITCVVVSDLIDGCIKNNSIQLLKYAETMISKEFDYNQNHILQVSKYGNVDLLDYIIHKVKYGYCNIETILIQAVMNEHFSMLDYILNICLDDTKIGFSIFMNKHIHRRIEILDYLIKYTNNKSQFKIQNEYFKKIK